MDIKQLQYFLEIYRLQSFSEAAKVCMITPQGIHVSISRLEAEIGAKLFLRTSSGVLLTPAGEYLLPKAQEIVRISADALDHFSHLSGRENTLSLLFVRGTVELLALPSMAEFKTLEPNVDIRFGVEKDLDCINAVISGDADLAVCSGPINAKELSKKLLLTGRNMLVINKSDPLAQKDCVSVNDLKDIHLALPRANVSIRNRVLELCRKRGFVPELSENDEPRTAFNFAEMGLQAGIVNEVSARKLLRDTKNVTIIPFDTPEMNWEVYLIKKKDAAQTAHSRTYESCLFRVAKDAKVL